MSVFTYKTWEPNFTYITQYCQLSKKCHICPYCGFNVGSIPVAILLYCNKFSYVD
jgi:hypothetical protein